MPKVSQKYRRSQESRILKAATKCFARRGFEPTTIQDVCKEAGISHGALYRYFPNKAALIAATAEQLKDQFMAGFENVAVEDGDLGRMLESVAPDSYDWIDAPGASFYLAIHLQWWAEATRNEEVRSPLVNGFFDTWRNALAEIVVRAQARNKVRSDIDPHCLAAVLLSTYYGLVLQKALDPAIDVSGYKAATRALYNGSLISHDA